MKLLRFFLVGIVLILPVLPVEAANAPTNPTSGQGLEISPPVMDLQADPGQTLTVKIKLRNITSGPLVVTGKADDFGAKDEKGNPQILLDETSATRYSLKYWISSVPSLTLQPQEQQTLAIPIAVPANAEPGGHYGVIRFTGLPPDVQGTGVSLSASLGALVLLRVSGKVTEGLAPVEFFASQNGHKGGFFEYGPIDLSERIRNTGNVHVQPVGDVKIYDMLGHQVGIVPINNPPHNILPDSIRRFDQTFNQRHLFGRYQAAYTLVYGTSNQQISASMSFWVIPWRLIIIFIAVLIVLALLLRTALRRYNRHIIERSRRP